MLPQVLGSTQPPAVLNVADGVDIVAAGQGFDVARQQPGEATAQGTHGRFNVDQSPLLQAVLVGSQHKPQGGLVAAALLSAVRGWIASVGYGAGVTARGPARDFKGHFRPGADTEPLGVGPAPATSRSVGKDPRLRTTGQAPQTEAGYEAVPQDDLCFARGDPGRTTPGLSQFPGCWLRQFVTLMCPRKNKNQGRDRRCIFFDSTLPARQPMSRPDHVWPYSTSYRVNSRVFGPAKWPGMAAPDLGLTLHTGEVQGSIPCASTMHRLPA